MITVDIKNNVEKVEKVNKYPYIGEHSNGGLVLFTGRGTGTVIKNVCSNLGKYFTDWDESDFKKYKGQVMLENV